ncbi:unnamed protein product [Toxocara canis]|uniref:Uncharacterized protein n=1 Tax=Toxocara canis TaxID=6265 RepID=A0A183VGS6_TOXCA|nr:unnamed protein product [Toxocara canis]
MNQDGLVQYHPYGSGADLLHGGFQQLCDQQQTAGGPFEALKPSQQSPLVTAQALSPFSGWKRRKVNQSQPRVQGDYHINTSGGCITAYVCFCIVYSAVLNSEEMARRPPHIFNHPR